jgi:hypothetical protein
MHMTHTPETRGAVDRISDSIRKALSAADRSSDIQDIIESARAALVEAEAVSLFGIETPHPEFGSVHWIVGRTDLPGGDYLVLAIPDHADDDSGDWDTGGWPIFTAGADDLSDAFRQLPAGFVEAPLAMSAPEAELAVA